MKELKDLKYTTEVNVDGEQLLEMLGYFLEETVRGSTIRSRFEQVIAGEKYYHENDLDEVDDGKFLSAAEERGFKHIDDIQEVTEALPTYNGKTKSVDEWKLKAIMDNFDRFSQEDFEAWINSK